jgi:hypothetical protein
MERCVQSRHGSGTLSPDIPAFSARPPRTKCSSASSPAFATFWGSDDPVIAERRSRRRRAVIAGLIATAVLGGGMAGVLHPAPARPAVVQHQTGHKQ